MILCLPLCIASGYLYSLRVPREYYSKVTLEIAPDRNRTSVFDDNSTQIANLLDDPKFVPNQFQIIQSKEMLYPVIDELKLVEKWAAGDVTLPKEQIYFRLLKMIEIKEVRNTDLLEIGVYSRDPLEAANIANAIAMEYQKRRIEDNEKMFALNLSEMKDEVEKQRKKAEEAHAEVVAICQREHIIDPTPERLDLQAQNQGEEYRAAKKKYLQEKALLDNAETRYATQKMDMQISF